MYESKVNSSVTNGLSKASTETENTVISLTNGEPLPEPQKKKKKKIIKKIIKKKVKKSKDQGQGQELNANTSNNNEPVKYSLSSFITRTGGTAMLPHFSYFEKRGTDWLVFDDGNYAVCNDDDINRSKSMAILYLYEQILL